MKAASDDLDFLALAVLDALLVLHADTAPVPPAKLTALLGDRVSADALSACIGCAAGAGPGVGRREPSGGRRGRPPRCRGIPARPRSRTAGRSAEEIAGQLDGLDDDQRQLLDRLLSGSPVGRTRDAAPGTSPDRPVQRLLAAGLLRQVDDETVILPRVVGQVLRGEEPGPVSLVEPTPATSKTTARDVDAAAAGAVIDLLRETELVLETLGAAPVPELRSGGLGVREAKRLTKLTGIDEQRLGLILEVSAAAGLIAAGMPRPEPLDGDGPYWAPDGAGRPLQRPTDRPALASVGDDVVGPAVAAGARGATRTGQQTDRGAVGCAVLHRRTAGSSAPARRARRITRLAQGLSPQTRRGCCCGDGRAGRCDCSRGQSAT